MRIDTIVVHHSASPFGCARIIDQWHRERGWSMNGYHAVIGNGRPFSSAKYLPPYDGLLELGRTHDLDAVVTAEEQGAHAAALGMNARSLGVCLIGEDLATYTPRQLRRLLDWLSAVRTCLRRDHGLDPAIKGHKEIDRKKPLCPSLNMERLRALVLGGLDHRVFTDRELKTYLKP